jgi:peptidoglycan/xylan/chitin deacetylase (PgdA/CDA1 family)
MVLVAIALMTSAFAVPSAAAIRPSQSDSSVAPAVSTTVQVSALTKVAAAYDIRRGPNTSRRYILTFDDCPNTTLAVFRSTLAWLKSHGFGIVIAPTGDCITSYKRRYGVDIAVLARSYGQYVINHSVSHPDLRTLSYANMVKQLKAPGVVTNYGRPPGGNYNATVSRAYASVGMLKWLWSVDTNDWRGKSRATLVKYVVANTHAGDTVLMHMKWNGFTPTAMGQMFVGLYKRGLLSCRVYRGMDNAGPAITAPVRLPAVLPC